MKPTTSMISSKWKWNGIVAIGGVLIGAGVADSLFAINQLDLNQIARGLTIFSAGLTILVVMDNSKTQKESELVQKETQARLEKVENMLNTIHNAQQMTDTQLGEIKGLLHKSNPCVKEGTSPS